MKLKLYSLEPLTREDESFKVYDVVNRRIDDYLDLCLGGTPSLLIGHSASGKTLLSTIAYCIPMYVDKALFSEIYDPYVLKVIERYLYRRESRSRIVIGVKRLLVSIDRDVAKELGLRDEIYEFTDIDLVEHANLMHKIVLSYLACNIVGVPEYLHLSIPTIRNDPESDVRYQRLIDTLITLRDYRFNLLAWAEEAEKLGKARSLDEALIRALLTLATLPRLHPYHLARIADLSEREYGCEIVKELVEVSIRDIEKMVSRILNIDSITLNEVSTYLSTGVNTLVTILTSVMIVPHVSNAVYDALCSSGIHFVKEGSSSFCTKTILFIDEPFSGLSLSMASKFWHEVFEYLSRLRKVYVSTHRFEVSGFFDKAKPREVVVLLRLAKNTQRVIDELRLVDPSIVDSIRIDAEYLQSNDVVSQRLRKAFIEDSAN